MSLVIALDPGGHPSPKFRLGLSGGMHPYPVLGTQLPADEQIFSPTVFPSCLIKFLYKHNPLIESDCTYLPIVIFIIGMNHWVFQE